MSFAKKYIDIHSPAKVELPDGFIPEIAIVIPCYKEALIFETLDSLKNADRPCKTLVLIVVNYSERVSDNDRFFHKYLKEVLDNWCMSNSASDLFFATAFAPDLRRKHAGAGLARKIGMDAAIDVFNRFGNENGIIASLDADTLIEENYLSELYSHFSSYADTNAVTIGFTHRAGEVSGRHSDAIKQYELYLRYMVLSMRYCGFPYAYHTIGSCFAVKVSTYVKQGGMNRKHAGEDFYFLHKIFPLGKCYDLYGTTVFPSARFSNRVPFGTGPAIKKIVDEGGEYHVYSFDAFNDLKFFYTNTVKFMESDLPAGIPQSLEIFFSESDFQSKLIDSRRNSKDKMGFIKRLLSHFDAFQLVKYLNFTHENGLFEKKPVNNQVVLLLNSFGIDYKRGDDLNEVLLQYERANLRQPE